MSSVLRNGAGSYAVVRLDKVQATKSGNIATAKYYVASTPTAIENAHVVKLDGLMSGENDIFKAVVPTAETDKVVLVASVEKIYDESSKAKGYDDFRNEAGALLRVIYLNVGDIISISDIAITAVANDLPVVGNYLEPQADTKFKEVASLGGTEGVAGKIIAKETWGYRQIPMTVIEIVKA